MNKTTEPIDSKTSQSFERFERLAKALVAVPKKELEMALAKEKRKNGSAGARKKAPKRR